jgi:ABC-type uncharacterized transport system ATPase subunit
MKLLADLQTQADPSMKSGTLTYTRITAKRMRKALIEEKGYTDEELPSEVTISNILNRLGYNLKRVQKAKPQKKLKKLMKSLKMYGEKTKNPMKTLAH